MLSDFMAKQMRCSDNCETVLLPAGLIYFTVLFFFFCIQFSASTSSFLRDNLSSLSDCIEVSSCCIVDAHSFIPPLSYLL